MGKNLESGDYIKRIEDPNINPLSAATNVPRINLYPNEC